MLSMKVVVDPCMCSELFLLILPTSLNICFPLIFNAVGISLVFLIPKNPTIIPILPLKEMNFNTFRGCAQYSRVGWEVLPLWFRGQVESKSSTVKAAGLGKVTCRPLLPLVQNADNINHLLHIVTIKMEQVWSEGSMNCNY